MADPIACPHAHTQLIAEDEHEKYVECLDCGAILEAGEMKNPSSFHESLSDA
jgi:transcription initiation factor TFIIIB Brf1 subunit/transcription initiation factor TFIIB